MNGLVQMTCPVCEDRYYGEYCPECACRETEARGLVPGTGEKLADYERRCRELEQKAASPDKET